MLNGPDGKVVARNPSQVRVEVLIDDGCTPTDPSDDEFLEFLGVVKESTGRSDEFCEAAESALDVTNQKGGPTGPLLTYAYSTESVNGVGGTNVPGSPSSPLPTPAGSRAMFVP